MSENETQRNHEVVLQYVAAFNACDLDVLVSLFEPDAVIHGVLKVGSPEDMRPIWKMLHDTLGAELKVVGVSSEGSSVAVRYIESGSSRRGDQVHKYEVTAMEWFEIRGGKIREWWGARDSGAIRGQLEA